MITRKRLTSALSAVALGILAGILSPAPASAALSNCSVAALAALNVPNLTITSATDVPAAAPNPEYCVVVATRRVAASKLAPEIFAGASGVEFLSVPRKRATPRAESA